MEEKPKRVKPKIDNLGLEFQLQELGQYTVKKLLRTRSMFSTAYDTLRDTVLKRNEELQQLQKEKKELQEEQEKACSDFTPIRYKSESL